MRGIKFGSFPIFIFECKTSIMVLSVCNKRSGREIYVQYGDDQLNAPEHIEKAVLR